MSTARRPLNRQRASSITQALDAIPLNNAQTEDVGTPGQSLPDSPSNPVSNPALQLNGSSTSYEQAQVLADSVHAEKLRKRLVKGKGKEGEAGGKGKGKDGKGRRGVVGKAIPFDEDPRYKSDGFWSDVRTGKWMLIPSSSLILLLIPVLFHLNHQYILTNPSIPLPSAFRQLVPLNQKSPVRSLMFLSAGVGNGKYKRSLKDFIFVTYYVVFFSFVRQSLTVYLLRPLAKYLGIRGAKIERFTEQGYAVIYFGFFGSLGVYVMRGLPIWWYKTSAFWSTFPTLEMPGLLKAYYLLQASYWCQQAIILVARVEKPRKDFKELVAHHIVTLWLIGWSYVTTLTFIGVAVFVTMDVSDIFLALAKCVNYVDEDASAPVFAFFVLVWTYFRHYQNIRILISVWTEFDLIPEHLRQKFRPWREDSLVANFMKHHIFAPILLLQMINLFWYFLILRILYRAVFGSPLADERSDDEGGDEEVDSDGERADEMRSELEQEVKEKIQ